MSSNTKLNIPAKRRRRASLNARRARSGYLFILPFIIGVVFVYFPILLDSIWMGFSDSINPMINGVSKQMFVFDGLSNFRYAFLESPDFTTKLFAGIQQIVFQVPAIIIFSLFIAVILNQRMAGRAVFRAIFFVPVIIATGLMESINGSDIMSGVQGSMNDGTGSSAANQIISSLDIERLFATMKVGGEMVETVVTLVNNIYDIINYSGVQMLIFLAGLQSISPAIYEACQIEGATAWETFWKVTFPMISPMILVNTVYTIIDSFTRDSNPAMQFIRAQSANAGGETTGTAMAWIFFLVVMLIIGAVAAIVSSFIFYQRRD